MKPLRKPLKTMGWGIALCVVLMIGWQRGLMGAQPPELMATVAYAKSGQTLELQSELSPQLPVLDIRLAGIQAPDLRQEPWGPAARECLATLTAGTVRIEPQTSTPDGYNRLWAYVWAGQQLVNAELLAQGCAFLESDRSGQQRYGEELVYAQEYARLLGLGIWSADQPLRETPASFRQRLSSS